MPRATILIVEDNVAQSQALAEALQFAGFTTLQAQSGIQALQIATESRPDLILMDTQLSDLDGLAAAETLKSDPVMARIPIVVMTAHDLEGEQARTMTRTCVGYVQKPVQPRHLVTLITAILKLPSEEVTPAKKTHAKPPADRRR